MKISIITPCYNSEKYIAETIESVIYQRGNFEIEYIIVDGGSIDGTMSIVRRYEELIKLGKCFIKCNGVSFTHISERDEGMYDALCKGFRLASGDIVAYINADDFYLPNAFSTIIEIFGAYSEIKWLTGMPVDYNEKGQITGCYLPFVYHSTLIRQGFYGTTLPFIQQESTFWRAELLNLLDFNRLKTYKFAGDFYMWYVFSKHTSLYIVQSCLGGFRSREDQLSKQKDEYHKEFYSIAEKRVFLRVIQAYLYKIANFLFPNRCKRRLNKKIIHYRNGVTVKWK